MNKRIVIALALTAMLVGLSPFFTSRAAAPQVAAQAKVRRLAAPGRVIVKFRNDAAATDAEQFIGAHSLVRRMEARRLQVIEIPSDLDASSYARFLEQMPGVEFAEPDYLIYPASTAPNDPLYNSEWHLSTINASSAWGVSTGNSQIILAVCDTGVDGTQPDLSSQMIPGWNVVDNNNDTSPVHPHGTWVAGTAAAASNNGVGVAAPAMDCRIMPVRITSRSDGGAATSDIVAATIWAVDHGARVINVSYAGYGSSAISDAAQYARGKNCIFVMAAGNDAGYVPNNEDPNIIAVSATGPSDGLAGFTSTGPYIDLAAPGVSIWTTGLQGTYESVNGTSFSAPLVAGVAALMLSASPALTAAQVDALLKVSADDRGAPGYDTGYGFGRLNAGRALELTWMKAVNAPDVTAPGLRFLTPLPDGLVGQTRGELVQIDAVDDRQVRRVSLYADDVLVGQTTAAPYAFTWNTSALADGSLHTLRAVATDMAGNTASLQFPVTVQAGYDITPPQIRITSPVDGASVNPPNSDRVKMARVTVNASDNSGNLFRVELYVDGVLVTRSTQAPYTLSWQPDQFARGRHTLVCLAYDSSFNVGRSNVVTVTK